ncbi:MAG: methionine synthase, partial [Candidatus Dadabacteria bacterium]
DGMAKTSEKKLEVARRIFERATEKHGIPPEAIIYDPLTFTIASGDEDSRKAALETLKAVKMIKEEIPRSRTILGISNVSFGLKPYPRQILNSVFLAEAIKNGLDACIVHPRKILPVHKIDGEIAKIALDLIYDRRAPDYDPLFVFMEKLQGASRSVQKDEEESGTVEEKLKKRIIDGRKKGIEDLLDKALRERSALEIINEILLDGMKTVGDLFGSGQMQLPFVLQSAETMKASVSYLEQFMDKSEEKVKGTMVIATVKGDVHDIGKNLVDIILSNNGYKVINLGIKQPADSIIKAINEHNPDAVGLSGLLVKSAHVMKENLEIFSQKGISVPVICGGAALNRRYVETDLREAYKTGAVYYGSDAFSGLQIMESLGEKKEEPSIAKAEPARKRLTVRKLPPSDEYVQSDIVPVDSPPEPPFWGVRHIGPESLDLNEIFTYVNKKALFVNQWMFRRGKRKTAEYREFIKNRVEPIFHQWCKKVIDKGWLAPKVAYGYFPCGKERNDLVIFDPKDQKKEILRFTFPRQRIDKRRCLSDFFLPVESGKRDVVAFHIVTVGDIASKVCKAFFEENRYTDYLYLYGLSVETAEALAEYWHKVVRGELGIAGKDGKTVDMLFRQVYQGARYSFGYPACPSLEKQVDVARLLDAEKIGVTVSSEFQLEPEQSTSAIIVHHPEAYYFSV